MTTCRCCEKELTPSRDGGTRVDCIHCGTINYVRLGAFDKPGWGESLTLSKETVWALLIGGAGAWVVVFMDVPFLRFILNYFITLVHEFGHALMSIALGFPAVPAFDFTHGGGVTVTLDDANMGLRVVVFGALAFAVLYFRKYKTILLMPLSVMVFNFCCLKYGWEETAIVYMGHGTVLLMSCVFLFRGLSDVAVHDYLEKILYFFLGFLSVFSEFSFARQVINDADYRFLYIGGKGGVDNDFVKLSEYLSMPMDTLLAYHIVASVAVPVVAYFAYCFAMKFYSR